MMLTKSEAMKLLQNTLKDTPKTTHSIVVSALMKSFAAHFGVDTDLWEVVGLCHDLDFYITASDRAQHGIVSVKMLENSLPPEALQAIAAHDHRTGISDDSLLAQSLKTADALAIIGEYVPAPTMQTYIERGEQGYDLLREVLGKRHYLSDIIKKYGQGHTLSLSTLLNFLSEATNRPTQSLINPP